MSDKLPPPSYLNLFIPLAIITHQVIPIRKVLYPPFTYLGGVLIFLGLLLNLWSVKTLSDEKTPLDFNAMPQKLVRKGPFRHSRNPLYLGGVILLLGLAVFLGSIVSIIFPIASFLILDRVYIPVEEIALEKKFKEDYLDYMHKVRRWV